MLAGSQAGPSRHHSAELTTSSFLKHCASLLFLYLHFSDFPFTFLFANASFLTFFLNLVLLKLWYFFDLSPSCLFFFSTYSHFPVISSIAPASTILCVLSSHLFLHLSSELQAFISSSYSVSYLGIHRSSKLKCYFSLNT